MTCAFAPSHPVRGRLHSGEPLAAYRIVFRDGSDEEVFADAFARAGDLLEFRVSQSSGNSSSTHIVRAVPCGSIERVDWLTEEGGAVPLDLLSGERRSAVH